MRGQLLLVTFVATLLSVSFWAIGLPFWLLLGVFAGIVEVIPVIGPLLAGAVAVAVGLTVSWHLALFAGLVVLVVRQIEDYVVIPRVMGHVTGLSPMLVLVSVSCVGLLLGPFYVLIATPVVATIVTLLDVIVRDKDPAEEQEAIGRWQQMSNWRKAVAIGAFSVGTFGLGFTVGGLVFGRWRRA